MKRIAIIILLTAVLLPAMAQEKVNDTSTRKERNYIREGNGYYEEKRFADAEVAYRKALEENAASEIAMYNLATSLIRQSGSANPNEGNNPMAEAQSLLQTVAQSARDISVAENAFYNLGNMAFNQQQYDQAINMYKGALRKNPDNDKARENLRLAQLKRQEQQQNQDKDQNKDQDKQDQDKDQQQRQPIGREELGQGVGLQKAADHRRQQVPARRQPEVEPGGKARLQHKVHKGRVGQDLQGAGQQQKDLQDHSRAPR